VDAAIGLLGAGFEQIEKLFVVAEELADREHKCCYSIAPRMISKAMLK
jgi:hypothetical protein